MRLKIIFSTVYLVFTFAFINSCNQNPKSVKLGQYKANGSQLYQQYCSNCHQPDGTGLGNLIPPLKNNYSIVNKAFSICIIKNGLSGKLEVDGKTYNGNMPAMPLSHLEIAEIMTFINNSWGQTDSITTIFEVEKALSECY